MDSKTNTDKIPIRGWLILVAVTLWLTAIGSVLVFILSLIDGLPWLESLLIIVTATLSIIALALLLRRKRKFVPWFLALIAWSVLSAVVSTVLGFTSISSFVYTIIGNIILSLYVVRSERVKNTFGVKLSERVTRMTWFVALGLVLVCLGWVIFYTYPRHIALAVKGVEYKLDAPQQGVKPVSLQLNGTLHRSLWGKRTFDGTVDIEGSSIPNKDNGKTLKIVFNRGLGGELTYFNWTTRQFYMYGYLYANKSFTKFTVLEYQDGGRGAGWNSGNGLMISAPAQSREQALKVSNNLMKARLLPGHPLK